MRKYESVIVFDGQISDEEIQDLQERIREIIAKGGGEITREDTWGRRRLAYEIKKRREGYYVLFYFSAESPKGILDEIDRFCRIQEKVLRHMICHEVHSKFAKASAKEKEERREEAPAKPEKMEEKTSQPEETPKEPEKTPEEPEGTPMEPEKTPEEPKEPPRESEESPKEQEETPQKAEKTAREDEESVKEDEVSAKEDEVSSEKEDVKKEEVSPAVQGEDAEFTKKETPEKAPSLPETPEKEEIAQKPPESDSQE